MSFKKFCKGDSILYSITRQDKKIKIKKTSENIKSSDMGSVPHAALPRDFDSKLSMLHNYIKYSSDIVVRTFSMHITREIKAAVIFMQGITDISHLNENILKPLIHDCRNHDELESFENIIEFVENKLLLVGSVKRQKFLDKVVQDIFDGLTVIFIDGVSEVLIADIKGGDKRSLNEPLLNRTICGPREGFIENLSTNISLIRRKLKDPNLVVEKFVLGKRSRSEVAVLYIKDIAWPEIVEKIINKIKNISIDGLLSPGYINQFIEDNPFSLFPLYREIERADIAVAELLEGRIVILQDQSPLAIVYPVLFIELMQAAEDYYTKPMHGSMMRVFRYVAFFLATSLPALYISLVSFRHELIPYELIVPIAKIRSKVPFPAAVEVLILEVIIQIIFEAGIRLPSPLGQTIGVVAGIILGQAIISASLASPAVIVIIAIATISTFAIPDFCISMTARILRFIFIAAASVFGMFGFSIAWMFVIVHLANQNSMGVAYFSPYAPLKFADMKDSLTRSSIFSFFKRPKSIPVRDDTRQSAGSKNDKERQEINCCQEKNSKAKNIRNGRNKKDEQ